MLIPKDFLNTSCQLLNPNNSIVSTGKLIEAEQDHAIIRAGTAEFPPLTFLSFIKVIFSHPSAGYRVYLANISESSEIQIRLTNIRLLTDDERRGYFRVHFQVTSSIYRLPMVNDPTIANPHDTGEILVKNNSAIISAPPYAIKPEEIFIVDMSLSGLLFSFPEYLQIGQRIIVEVPVPKRRSVDYFLVNVKRRFKNELEEKSPFLYGCTFLENSSSKMDSLCRTILDQQALLIAKAKRPTE